MIRVIQASVQYHSQIGQKVRKCLTFSNVEIRGAEVSSLVHRRRGVDEKEDDSHLYPRLASLKMNRVDGIYKGVECINLREFTCECRRAKLLACVRICVRANVTSHKTGGPTVAQKKSFGTF